MIKNTEKEKTRMDQWKISTHSRPVTEECDQTAWETGAKDEERVRVKAQSSLALLTQRLSNNPPATKTLPLCYRCKQMQTLRHKQKRQKTQIHTLIPLPAWHQVSPHRTFTFSVCAHTITKLSFAISRDGGCRACWQRAVQKRVEAKAKKSDEVVERGEEWLVGGWCAEGGREVSVTERLD